MKVHWKDNICLKQQKQEKPVFATNHIWRSVYKSVYTFSFQQVALTGFFRAEYKRYGKIYFTGIPTAVIMPQPLCRLWQIMPKISSSRNMPIMLCVNS